MATIALDAQYRLKKRPSDARRLSGHLYRIRTALQRDLSSRRCRLRLAQRLGALTDFLAMHFATEQVDVFDGENPVPSTQLALKFAALQAEHAALFDRLCDVAERANEAAHFRLLGYDLARLVRDLRGFCDDLDRHENEEDGLVLSGYFAQLGIAASPRASLSRSAACARDSD